MASSDAVHTPDDGRGPRRVLLDGVPLERCFFADTRRGVARVYHDPLRLDKRRKRVLTRTVRGRITVETLDG